MLLPEEPELRDYLTRPLGSGVQALVQVGVFLLNGRKALVREQISRCVGRFEQLQAIFRGERTATKAGEFLAEASDELLELMERGHVIYAV